MARSILPSRWRGAAQARAGIHREVRREVGQSLRALERDPSLWDGGVELGEAPGKALAPFVRRRQGSDKLNHFERWAVERTRDLPLGERLGHLRGLLPAGLIGRHAMTHLVNRAELRPAQPDRSPRWQALKLLLDRGELAALLRALLDVPGGVRALHRALKQAVRLNSSGQVVRAGARRLQGHPDVLPFLDWLERSRVSRYVVDAFCRVFKQTRDVHLALARSVAPAPLPALDVVYLRLR